MPFYPGIAASAGTVAFSPLDIAGLVLWLDGALSGKSYASGSLVSQWTDLSGNNNHATFSAGNEADDVGRSINGITALDFDSAKPSYGVCPTGGLGITNALHICMVLVVDSIASARFVYAGCSNVTDDGYQLRQDSGGVLGLYTSDGVGRNLVQSAGTFSIATPFLAEGWADGTTEVGVGIDGTLTSETPTNGCLDPDTTAIFAGHTGVGPSDGAVAAVYIYDHELNSGDRSSLLSYINARFGV